MYSDPVGGALVRCAASGGVLTMDVKRLIYYRP